MLTIGGYGELTVSQAREKAQRAKLQIRDGVDPKAVRERDAVTIPTVGKLLDRWLDDYAKVHRRRHEEDRQRIDRHVRPKLGKLPLDGLTRDVIASWHRTIGKATPVEANRSLETLGTAWRWAHGEQLIAETLPADPTANIKKFREFSRDRWLTEDEVGRLMDAVAKEDDPYVQAAIPLFLLTGLRRRELFRAEWKHVDLERGEIRLPTTKTGIPQVRLLPAPAVDLLRQLPRMRESPYVFPSPANPKRPRDAIKKPWERIRERAKLPDVTLHDLRRTAGSHMAQAGVPLLTIAEILGHQNAAVTKLYARLASENSRQALDTLSQRLGGALRLVKDTPDTGTSAA
jgi:integrase